MSVCWCVRGLCVCWCVRGLCVCVSQTLNPAVPDLSNLAPLQVVRANTHIRTPNTIAACKTYAHSRTAGVLRADAHKGANTHGRACRRVQADKCWVHTLVHTHFANMRTRAFAQHKITSAEWTPVPPPLFSRSPLYRPLNPLPPYLSVFLSPSLSHACARTQFCVLPGSRFVSPSLLPSPTSLYPP